MSSKEIFVESSRDSITDSKTDKCLIVLSSPSVVANPTLSKENIMKIIEYMIHCANIINGKDEVVILVNADTKPLFKDKVPSNILLEANIYDIWIRDFGSVIPSKQIKFKYSPDYQPKPLSE